MCAGQTRGRAGRSGGGAARRSRCRRPVRYRRASSRCRQTRHGPHPSGRVRQTARARCRHGAGAAPRAPARSPHEPKGPQSLRALPACSRQPRGVPSVAHQRTQERRVSWACPLASSTASAIDVLQQHRNRRELFLRVTGSFAERIEMRGKWRRSASFHDALILPPHVRVSYGQCAGAVGGRPGACAPHWFT